MSTRTVNPTQWTEIPVPGGGGGVDFYGTVFGCGLGKLNHAKP